MENRFDQFLTNNEQSAIIPAMPDDVYHAEKRFLSKHALDLIADSPEKYKWALTAEPEEPTKTMKFGSAFHCFILEPERFDEKYIVISDAEKAAFAELEKEFPEEEQRVKYCEAFAKAVAGGSPISIFFVVQPPEIKVRRGKAWEAFIEANPGAVIVKNIEAATRVAFAIAKRQEQLTQEDFATIEAMAESVKRHELAGMLYNLKGEPEVTVLGRIEGIPFKARLDCVLVNPRIVIDYKTVTSAAPDDFISQAANFRYDVQAALYLDLIEAATRDKPRKVNTPWRFIFVAVEKKPPYAVATYLVDEWMGNARITYQRDIETFLKCKESENWNGYKVYEDQLPCPKWLMSKRGF